MRAISQIYQPARKPFLDQMTAAGADLVKDLAAAIAVLLFLAGTAAMLIGIAA